ncbi:AzlD domain-containing protein [Gordonia hankookensis]|uniref:AzlD domain-containing protein n=1 Tax=Gordonia hankookensis TaxID=589403 RepID=A0ABR7WHK5_9ACTN|nr:AzlD domain-containing protein [Gordonia hankookensis]MBD1321252.1 AzlD domain-containing protein [Gordonia hankookensis]NDZ97155.1 AzlD domain-containing protein [Streptomyces sp. SID11726]NEB22724.1 AzlD domain-containing protein [Streptomyces sp. SID6673]NED70429.1 AzlD domain-containing protein [Streptomyces sp. SID10244]
MSTTGLFIGVGVLAVGTYLIRLAGPALRNRYEVSPQAAAVMDRAAIVLLVGVAATGALFAGHDLVGWARPAGVTVGIIAALCKAPLVVVVLLAALVAAGLRAAGVA